MIGLQSDEGPDTWLAEADERGLCPCCGSDLVGCTCGSDVVPSWAEVEEALEGLSFEARLQALYRAGEWCVEAAFLDAAWEELVEAVMAATGRMVLRRAA